MSSYQSSNFAGEIWLQWFGCCTNQPAQQRKRQAVQRSRARIDRSTIGYPMNFQHTVHIGSGDLEIESSHLDALQGQMQSKGGYGKAHVKVRISRSQSLNEVIGLTRFRFHHRIMVPRNLLNQFNTLTHSGGNIATISNGDDFQENGKKTLQRLGGRYVAIVAIETELLR